MMDIKELQLEIYEWAKSKGWWEETRNIGELIALMHSELSEALEEYRKGYTPRDIYWSGDASTKPEGVAIELADVIIRVLDFCEHYGIDTEEMLRIKMAYNHTRPYRHGNKLA